MFDFSSELVVTQEEILQIFNREPIKETKLEDNILITMFQKSQIEAMEELDSRKGTFKGKIPNFGVVKCSGTLISNDDKYFTLNISGEYQKSQGFIENSNRIVFTPFEKKSELNKIYIVYPYATYIIK